MKKIKIHQGNSTKVKEIIDEIQGKCYANVIDAYLVSKKIQQAENQLMQLKIPKKSWAGIRYTYQAGGRKRGWVNRATKIVLEYGSNNWYLIHIERDLSSILIDRVELTDTAKLNIPTYIHLK